MSDDSSARRRTQIDTQLLFERPDMYDTVAAELNCPNCHAVASMNDKISMQTHLRVAANARSNRGGVREFRATPVPVRPSLLVGLSLSSYPESTVNDDEIRKHWRELMAPRDAVVVVRDFLKGRVADLEEQEIERYARRTAASFPATIERAIDALSSVLDASHDDPDFFTNLVYYDANKNFSNMNEDTSKAWLQRLLANLRAWTQ